MQDNPKVPLIQRIQQKLAVSCMMIEELESHAFNPDKVMELTNSLILQHKRVIKDLQQLEQKL